MVGASSVGDSNDNLAVMTMMNHMFRERDNTRGLDKAIENIVYVNGHFNGKYVTQYLEAYRKNHENISILHWY